MHKKIILLFSFAVLLLIACQSPKQSTGTSSDIIEGSKTLYQYNWELAELQGQAIPAGNVKIPYLQFAKGQINKVTGNTGCNNLNGTVTVWGSNAIKFSPEGSVIEVSSKVTNEETVVMVKDNGMGISKADQEHLFERFFRGTNVTNIQGTGLGLHIVGKYIEILDGNIEFASELEKGTTFIITLKQSS